MNRIRRRRLLKKLRANIRDMGNPHADRMSDEELEKLASRFGTLEQMVAITNPSAKIARDFAKSMDGINKILSRDDVQATGDERPAAAPQRGSVQTHDGAGELIRLRGGPMDDFLVREGAPVLRPGWPGGKGAYTRSDPPDRRDDGTEIATWVPS